MTKPKVSERIETLLTEYALAVVHSSMNDGLGSREVGNTRRALLSAIAEIEQRAEKWKAVALAHVALLQSLSGSVDEINAASKKAVDACKALGDEWDEAVKEDG